MSRQLRAERATAETRVAVDLRWPAAPGSSPPEVDTGLPFLDHLLRATLLHGGLDGRLLARGDLEVDGHHLIEDVGRTLGLALDRALGERRGIARFGWALVPMDDALVRVALDLGGRGYLGWRLHLPPRSFGAYHTEAAVEFFRGLADCGRLTLHVDGLSGENAHHLLEAAHKALGLALAQALAPRSHAAIPSTKGVLA